MTEKDRNELINMNINELFFDPRFKDLTISEIFNMYKCNLSIDTTHRNIKLKIYVPPKFSTLYTPHMLYPEAHNEYTLDTTEDDTDELTCSQVPVPEHLMDSIDTLHDFTKKVVCNQNEYADTDSVYSSSDVKKELNEKFGIGLDANPTNDNNDCNAKKRCSKIKLIPFKDIDPYLLKEIVKSYYDGKISLDYIRESWNNDDTFTFYICNNQWLEFKIISIMDNSLIDTDDGFRPFLYLSCQTITPLYVDKPNIENLRYIFGNTLKYWRNDDFYHEVDLGF